LLYFSAHWCGPCRGFTPVLKQVYEEISSTGLVEVVFISSDQDQQSFEEYYGEMPWLAVDFSDRERKKSSVSKI